MKSIYKFCLSAALLLITGACSDSNKYEPAPREEETMGVFFKELSTYDILVLDEADRLFTVNVARLNTEETATVPLKAILVPEGVKCPSSLEFKAGEETTSFELDLSDMPPSTKGNLILEIDPAFSSQYAAGTSRISVDITVSRGWILLADDLVISHQYEANTNIFPDQTTNLYALDGVNRFKIDNFLNSGLEFVFTVAEPWRTYSYIIPTTNCVFYKDLYTSDEYNSWFFYDTANATYPEWSIDGSNIVVEYMSFDSFKEGSEDDPESYIGINKGYGLLSTYNEYTNGKSAYHWMELNFSPKFNPFTTQE